MLIILYRQLKDDVLVSIILENSHETFTIQKTLLSDASEYFNKALNGGFKEAQKHVMRLPGCDIETLHLFMYWLYKHDLPDVVTIVDELPSRTTETKARVTELQLKLVRLWTFADKYLMPKLQNATMIQLLEIFSIAYCRAETASLAFNSSTQGAKIRTAVLHAVLYHQRPDRQTNAYNEQKYNEDAMNVLGATPGFLSAYHLAIRNSSCGMLACHCKRSCYSTSQRVHKDFLVPEL